MCTVPVATGAKTACSQMVNMGFTNVNNVRMGIMGWSGEIK